MYEMDQKTGQSLVKGREHVMKNYNFDNFRKTWVDVMTEIHEECGSWENRKGYNSWESIEL